MNYGHPLQFGTFVTPVNAPPEAPVQLARRAEELGFDLVTFQDHPYQPAFLDTWTLLAWVAGRTDRVQLAANVLNVPLRSPSVLARSAASLDLLSGGRLDLALGAGAFWDAIAAMGGQRLSPGEAVDALGEAIGIIRGLLDAGERTPLRLDGRHHQVDGAKRGPLPAHRIPIWLGARGPRMLRLIGQQADGWLPSLPSLEPGALRAGNTIIDEAALEAGRDPSDIRRLVNIAGESTPSEQWVDELLPLVVEDGVGTFVLMTDEAATMERFAREVVPALREAVDRELPAPLPSGPVRGAAVRAKRRQGIDYARLPPALAETAVEPGDVEYPRVRSTYLRGGSPGLVLRPRDPAEVVDALRFARAHPELPFGLRSAGHGISGRSTNDGGLVLDLAKLNSIEVLDERTRRVRIGPGARWVDVAAALAPYRWALTSGDYGGVGVGGLATAGGVGWLARKHGLTIDHLRAVELVLADGSVLRASDTENADLFWAVRGAGANFGVVTSFEFEVDEVSDIGWAQFAFDANDPAGLLVRWGAAVESAPRDLTGQLLLTPPRRARPAMAQAMLVVDSDQPDTIVEQLQPLASIAPLYDQNVVLTPYANVMANLGDGDHDGRGEPISRSGLIEHLTPEFADAAAQVLRSGVVFVLAIRAVGGAVSDVEPDATAYGYRSANFQVTALGIDQTRMDQLWDELRTHFHGLYLSFETDPRPERLADAFPPRTLERLRALKSRYDPDNVFRDNFNIPPSKEAS